jgi:hypothetical protein
MTARCPKTGAEAGAYIPVLLPIAFQVALSPRPTTSPLDIGAPHELNLLRVESQSSLIYPFASAGAEIFTATTTTMSPASSWA